MALHKDTKHYSKYFFGSFSISFIFLTLLILLQQISPLDYFKYFLSLKEISYETILVAQNGIFNFGTSYSLQKILEFSSNAFTSSDMENVQIIEFDLGYIIVKIKETYYVVRYQQILTSFNLNLSNNINFLLSYTFSSELCQFYSIYIPIDTLDSLIISKYLIRFNSNQTKLLLNNSININDTNFNKSSAKSNKISCQFMKYSTNQTKDLTCFYLLNDTIVATSFDINNINMISGAFNKGVNAGYIKSRINANLNSSLICYIEDSNINYPPLHCLTYNLDSNSWSQDQIIFQNSSKMYYNFNIYYNRILNEFVIYSLRETKMIQILFLKNNFSNKLISSKTCIILQNFTTYNEIYDFDVNYFHSIGKYYFIYTYQNESFLPSDSVIELSNICSEETEGFFPLLSSTDNKPYFNPTSFENFEIEEKEIEEENFEKEEIIKDEQTFENEENIINKEKIIENEENFKNEKEKSKENNEKDEKNNEEEIEYSTNEKKEEIINKNTFIIPENIGDVIKYISNDGKIIKGESKKTKEEIVKEISVIIDSVKIGQKYEIRGKDYEINVRPIDSKVNENKTHVNFSECEKIIRKTYSIPEDEILTIIQIEINSKNTQSLTNQVEYAIYDSKKNKLNLSSCNNVIINYAIKDGVLNNTSLISSYSEQGVDILNINDEYFNSICYPDNNSDTDIILKDRINDIYQNYSICDSNCEYISINLKISIIECSCETKTNISVEEEEANFGEMVQMTFKNSNFGIVKCYNLLLNNNLIYSNIGLWIFSFLLIIHIPLFTYYFFFSKNLTKLFIFREMEKFNYIRISNPINKRKSARIFIKKNSSISSGMKFDFSKSSKTKELRHSVINSSRYLRNSNKNRSSNLGLISFNKNSKEIKELYKENYILSNYFGIKKNSSSKIKIKQRQFKKDDLFKEPNFPGYYHLIRFDSNILKYKRPPNSNYILTNYDYNEAVKYDNRNFWRIFLICLFFKQSILHAFFFKSDIEMQSLRICHFIFSYSCDFALNALFYINDKISDRYHYEGENLYLYSLINNITISIFSSSVSFILKIILHYLINSKKKIENVFREQEKKLKRKNEIHSKDKLLITNQIIVILNKLKIKIMIFIISELILMIFFTYYISVFCVVFKGTQISWLSDSIVSFIMSNLFEILVSFIIASVYSAGIRYRLELLYNIAIFCYDIGH